jgi:hypothetical protein
MTNKPQEIRVGDRVKILLDSKFWKSESWFEGTVVRIDRYSAHRSFYWVELDEDAQSISGARTRLISIFNPRNIRKTDG